MTIGTAVGETSINISEGFVGHDLLGLFGNSMYLSPLVVLREYVQNSTDAIDLLRRTCTALEATSGEIAITLDKNLRRILIRDFGAGLSNDRFGRTLTTIGASAKRGINARGFRGIGRLAGLGVCQSLTFRSRSNADETVMEITWDCQSLRQSLKRLEAIELTQAVRELTSTREIAGDYPAHFFEVEMQGVVRLSNDVLLDNQIVSDYLSQVAAISYSCDFEHSSAIQSAISPSAGLASVDITVNGGTPLTKPYGMTAIVSTSKISTIREVEIVQIPALDDGICAIAWIAHHDYAGAFPQGSPIRGLRLKLDGMQIGDESVLDGCFPESRFNCWTIGEVHIVDRRLVPNGRRDDLEDGAHYNNLLNHLSVIGRNIASRCRAESRHRQVARTFDKLETRAQVQIKKLRSTKTKASSTTLLRQALRGTLDKLSKAINQQADIHGSTSFNRRLAKLKKASAGLPRRNNSVVAVGSLLAAEGDALIDLIYNSASDPFRATILLEHIGDLITNASNRLTSGSRQRS